MGAAGNSSCQGGIGTQNAYDNSTYYYSGGWHIKAIYSLFIGFIFSASTIWNVDLRFLQSFSWLIGALMSSITYYLLANR